MEKKEQIENVIAPLNTVGSSAPSPSSKRIENDVRDG